MTNREKIAARIRALISKKVEYGCTDAEAVAAAELAAELLKKYNMTMDEVEMRKSPFKRHTEQHMDFVGDRLWKIAAALGELTGTRFWTSPAGVYPIEINFFGFEHEVEIAQYLLAVCTRAMRTENSRLLGRYALLKSYARRRKMIPFMDGMADSLSKRILAMKPEEPKGKGLIVLRGELIEAALKDAGVNLKNERARKSRDFDPHYLEGRGAGNAVALNPGVRDNSPEVRQIAPK